MIKNPKMQKVGSQRTDFPWKPPEMDIRNSDFGPLSPNLNFIVLQKSKGGKINLCCIRPPGIWQLVTAGTENEDFFQFLISLPVNTFSGNRHLGFTTSLRLSCWQSHMHIPWTTVTAEGQHSR